MRGAHAGGCDCGPPCEDGGPAACSTLGGGFPPAAAVDCSMGIAPTCPPFLKKKVKPCLRPDPGSKANVSTRK